MLPNKIKSLGGYKSAQDFNTDILNYEARLQYDKVYEEHIVTPELGHEYIGDFYGLLDHFYVERSLYPMTLYLNGLSNPVDYSGEPFTLKVPNALDIVRS